MDRVAAFYSAVLGVETPPRDDEHVMLESPAFQLAVLRMPSHIAATIEIEKPPLRRADVAIKLVFFVPSIAGARASAEASGGVPNALRSAPLVTRPRDPVLGGPRRHRGGTLPFDPTIVQQTAADRGRHAARNGQDIASGIDLFTEEAREGSQRSKFVIFR